MRDTSLPKLEASSGHPDRRTFFASLLASLAATLPARAPAAQAAPLPAAPTRPEHIWQITETLPPLAPGQSTTAALMSDGGRPDYKAVFDAYGIGYRQITTEHPVYHRDGKTPTGRWRANTPRRREKTLPEILGTLPGSAPGGVLDMSRGDVQAVMAAHDLGTADLRRDLQSGTARALLGAAGEVSNG